MNSLTHDLGLDQGLLWSNVPTMSSFFSVLKVNNNLEIVPKLEIIFKFLFPEQWGNWMIFMSQGNEKDMLRPNSIVSNISSDFLNLSKFLPVIVFFFLKKPHHRLFYHLCPNLAKLFTCVGDHTEDTAVIKISTFL